MAFRYAVASGNWSDPTIWDGGTLPGSADVVRANAKTVTIDQDIVVTELAGDALAPAVAGGSWVVSSISGTRTMECDITRWNTSLTVSAPTGHFVLNGNIISGGFEGVNSTALDHSGSCLVTINGTVNCGQRSNSVGSGAITKNSGSGLMTINGDIVARNTWGVSMVNSALIVNGNLRGDLTLGGGSCVRTIGNSVSVTINGSVYAGTNTLGVAFFSSGCVLDVTGDISAASAANGVMSTAVGNVVRVAGTLTDHTSGKNAVFADIVLLAVGANVTMVKRDDSGWPSGGDPFTLSVLGTSNPATADVRQGTVYAGGSIGTLAVPNPASVAAGVATDATVGTAALTPGDVWGFDPTTAVADTIGERLSNAATVSTVGSQLAAALGAP